LDKDDKILPITRVRIYRLFSFVSICTQKDMGIQKNREFWKRYIWLLTNSVCHNDEDILELFKDPKRYADLFISILQLEIADVS